MRKILVACALLAGCATVPPPPAPPVGEPELRSMISDLASDAFGGRMPGTEGEERTIAWIAAAFREAGLESGSRGPRPYLDPFPIESRSKPLPPEGAALPSGQSGFIEATNRAGAFTSHNVVGVVRGRRSDGRAVVVMAHWDHLGLCMPEGAPDRICNGAVDNASGVAALVATGRRVARMRLDRDVWFVATSAEEWGLLGAKAFAASPPLPLASIIAGFNLDTIAIAPRGAPVAMLAAPGANLEPLARAAAASLGRPWDGDEEIAPFLKRQDGWALAEKGVPMIMAGGSFSDFKLLQRFLAKGYHSPDDELRPGTELGGAVDDANLHVELVRRAASRRLLPARR